LRVQEPFNQAAEPAREPFNQANCMRQDDQNLIWIDLEMTGLDSDQDRIIEIATVVTNGDLEVLAEGPDLAIHQEARILASMDEWNCEHHGSSGLLERVSASACTEAEAQRLTLEFLSQYVAPGVSPMSGNSICQDRRFLHRSMPELEAYFHYRNLDVSSVKELCRRWAPGVMKGLRKRGNHRALDDVHDSIAELRYYREHFIRLP
jgi:oligoribonuclease